MAVIGGLYASKGSAFVFEVMPKSNVDRFRAVDQGSTLPGYGQRPPRRAEVVASLPLPHGRKPKCSSNARTVNGEPEARARSNGVLPSLLAANGSAPSFSSRVTIST